jgi:hypothetical protein
LEPKGEGGLPLCSQKRVPEKLRWGTSIKSDFSLAQIITSLPQELKGKRALASLWENMIIKIKP